MAFLNAYDGALCTFLKKIQNFIFSAEKLSFSLDFDLEKVRFDAGSVVSPIFGQLLIVQSGQIIAFLNARDKALCTF